MPAVARSTFGLQRLFGVIVAVALVLMLSSAGASAAEEDPSSFTATPTSGTAPLTVKFQTIYESDGCGYVYAWDFGDGESDTGSSPAHVYTKPGTYSASVQAVYDYCDFANEFPSDGPTDGPSLAAFGCGSDDDDDDGVDCWTSSTTITVSARATATPATVEPVDNDDSDDNEDSDDSDEESDDSDDSDDAVAPALPGPGSADATPTPSPTPTEPSDLPTEEPTITEPIPDPTPASSGYSGPAAPVIALMILAAVIGSLGRVGGLAVAGRQVAMVADRDENTVQRHVAARDAEGWGDKSFTWRFPGHKIIDAASVVIPDRFARFSPLIGRITEDGSEFRAMFGSLWLATPLAGIALGVAGAAAAGGNALPPSVWLLAAGAVLATFDAFSGALAVVVFAVAAFVGDAAGGPDFVHSLLVLLAIGFLWMAIPLIGSAIRPFRRLGDGSLRHRWDVAADGLIAALLCGWVAQKLTQAMDLFAGQKTGLPEHANTIAIVVIGAVALRVALEHFSMSSYPQRLQQVEGEDPPPPMLLSSVLGAFVRTAIFGFIGFAFIGSCWQLWLGVGLFLIPQLIEHIRQSFPNFGVIHRILPRGVVEVFILVVACTLAARFAMGQSPDQMTGLRLAFLLIAIPPALIGALAMLAEDDNADRNTTWPREFLGAVIVAVTVALAARGWDY